MKPIWSGRSEALPMKLDDITTSHRHHDDCHQIGNLFCHEYEDR